MPYIYIYKRKNRDLFSLLSLFSGVLEIYYSLTNNGLKKYTLEWTRLIQPPFFLQDYNLIQAETPMICLDLNKECHKTL